MYLDQHGLSNARDIQMEISEKSTKGCVVEDINKFMGFLTLIPSNHLFLAPQLVSPNPISDFRTLNNLIILALSCMLPSPRMSMLICL